MALARSNSRRCWLVGDRTDVAFILFCVLWMIVLSLPSFTFYSAVGGLLQWLGMRFLVDVADVVDAYREGGRWQGPELDNSELKTATSKWSDELDRVTNEFFDKSKSLN